MFRLQCLKIPNFQQVSVYSLTISFKCALRESGCRIGYDPMKDEARSLLAVDIQGHQRGGLCIVPRLRINPRDVILRVSDVLVAAAAANDKLLIVTEEGNCCLAEQHCVKLLQRLAECTSIEVAN